MQRGHLPASGPPEVGCSVAWDRGPLMATIEMRLLADGHDPVEFVLIEDPAFCPVGLPWQVQYQGTTFGLSGRAVQPEPFGIVAEYEPLDQGAASAVEPYDVFIDDQLTDEGG